jgi:energy-coupling factor transporter ATP-binding protein EcfA2
MPSLTPEALSSVHPYVSRVEVKSLFGAYNYELQAQSPVSDPSSLMVLYGENGTGKTTILALIYHLLSKEKKSGHRTFLAKTPFRSFTVHLSNKTVFAARRQKGALVGDFTMAFKTPRASIEYEYKIDAKGRIPPLEEDAHDDFTCSLPDISISMLTDDRKSVRPKDKAGSIIQRPLRSLVEWIREQALKGSNEGQRDVNAIYVDIVKRLAKADEASESAADLISKLTAQSSRNREYSKFGLTADLPVDEIVRAISSSTQPRIEILAQVLKPYLDSNEARLDALASLQATIATFVDNVNALYRGKQLAFTVRSGLTVVAADQQLKPESLSSGEKQLLVLFCNVVRASDTPTIFIIDEPELSLNVEWQRRLIGDLMKLGAGKIQFILATHSLELLARYRGSVARLEPQPSRS